MSTRYDAVVIGTGQAGPSLAVRLANSGRKTAVLERKRFGGTCVNVGCIPTKTLVASARAIHMARRGEEFGFTTGGPVEVDIKRVKARKDAPPFSERAETRSSIPSSISPSPESRTP